MVDKLTCVQNTHYSEFFGNTGKNTVFLLSEKSAENAWNREIYEGSSSYFDLPDECWIISDKAVLIGRWIEAYNNDDNAAVEVLLRKAVDWSDDTLINFFAKKKIVFRTQWSNFLLYWDEFIAVEDDCPIVTPESGTSKEAVLFRPIGDIVKISQVGCIPCTTTLLATGTKRQK